MTTTTATKIRLTRTERRSVGCPQCLASPGKPCRSWVGWCGNIDREHATRVAAARAARAAA
jgi:hypothetical protein